LKKLIEEILDFKNALGLQTLQTADLFPVEGKNILLALEMSKNILFSLKKVEKHTILAGQEGGGQVPSLFLPCGRPCLQFNLI